MGNQQTVRPSGISIRVGRCTFRMAFVHQLVIDGGPSVVLAEADCRCLTVSLSDFADGDASEELYARIGRAVVCAWVTANGIDNPEFPPTEMEAGHA
jgi:hypothetical protein